MEENGNTSDYPVVLIQEAIGGSQVAFRKLYDALSGKMYSLCLRYASDSEEANDFFQDGFIRLYRNLSSYRFEGSFEGWARRIFVTTCLDALKKRKVNLVEVNENLTIETREFGATQKLDLQNLMQIIQSLPDGFRTIVNLYLVEEYSHKEIAEILGISESSSKSKLHKARIMLKELLIEKSVV